ncbi:hypothetical protein PRIC1_008048 [Phytophthora ramorum]
MGTPGVQTQYPQYQPQQRYPTSNQVQWEDLQTQQPTHQNASQPQSYVVDNSLVQPQYQQREHDYQISDIVPTTARPQEYRVSDPGTPPNRPAPSAPSHVV